MSENGAAIAKRETQTSAVQLNEEQIALVKRTVLVPRNRQATDDELALFIHQAERTGLDPLNRQIYGIFRFDNQQQREVMTIQVAIDGLRLNAERTGKYLGQTPAYWCGPDLKWQEVWAGQGNPFAAKVGVYKAGAPEPIWAVAKFSSYADTRSPIWKGMPDNQLAKCAEALALRKAFPAELSGLYAYEEMEQADIESPEPAPRQDAPRVSGEPEEVDAQVVEEESTISKAEAGRIYDAAVGVDAIEPDQFAQAVGFVIEADPGDMSKKGKAVEVLSGLTERQAVRIKGWIEKKAGTGQEGEGNE